MKTDLENDKPSPNVITHLDTFLGILEQNKNAIQPFNSELIAKYHAHMQTKMLYFYTGLFCVHPAYFKRDTTH